MTGPADDVTMTVGGNATMLLRIGRFTLLTDPALQPEDLPPVMGSVLELVRGGEEVRRRGLPGELRTAVRGETISLRREGASQSPASTSSRRS